MNYDESEKSMDKLERDFVELTKRAIYGKCDDDDCFDETDWEGAYKLANKSKLAPVMSDVIKQQSSVSDEMRKKWGNCALMVYMRQASSFKVLCRIIEAIENAGIDYAVFKGPIISDAYPNFLYRSSSDTDILVDSKDNHQVEEIIKSFGYDFIEGKSKEKVHNFRNLKLKHTIELHTTVFEDYEGTKIDILKGAGIEDPANRIQVTIKGKNIRTINWNEHFIYLMFHMIKHFMLEGAGVKFMTDITLFVNKNKDKLSSEFFWEWMDKCNYTAFCENFFTICIKYFDMDPFLMVGRKAQATDEVLDCMLTDFIYVGDKNELRNRRWQLVGSISPYFTGEAATTANNKFGRIMSFAFPKAELLGERYSYAKKHKVLLPVAWVHRGVHRTWWSRNRKAEYYSDMQTISVVDAKLGLLGSVGLLDKE